MKKLFVSVVALGVMAVVGNASAATGEELAKSNNCLSCHSVDAKLVGPSFKDVSKKYKGQADAQTKLADKVKKGGSGNWGSVPMPPNPNVKDDDLKTILTWVLGL